MSVGDVLVMQMNRSLHVTLVKTCTRGGDPTVTVPIVLGHLLIHRDHNEKANLLQTHSKVGTRRPRYCQSIQLLRGL